MRTILFLPLLLVAGCDVDSDAGNDQVTLQYDEQEMKNTANAAARTTKEVASGLGNVAATTGRAIKNEVGDVDVDVDVTRNKEPAAKAKE